MKESAHPYLKFYTLVLLFIVLLLFLLYQGRILLIPLSFAFLICFMYYPLGVWIEKRIGRLGSIGICMLLLALGGYLLYQLLASSISILGEKLSASKERINALGDRIAQYITDTFSLDPELEQSLTQDLYQKLVQESLPMLKQVLTLSASALTMLLIIPVFVSLILYYRELLVRFVLSVVPDKQVEGFKSTIKELTTTYFRFAKGMLLVYLIVAVLNSIGFLLIGLPNAIYFGILASLLTFFPYIGIFIGGSAAVIVAWTTFNSIWYPIGVIAILAVVQYLEGNVIFPTTVGHQLKLNSLATLIVIIIGGLIWGGAGMVLFVPFAAILKILADRVDGLEPIGILLGPDSKK